MTNQRLQELKVQIQEAQSRGQEVSNPSGIADELAVSGALRPTGAVNNRTLLMMVSEVEVHNLTGARPFTPFSTTTGETAPVMPATLNDQGVAQDKNLPYTPHTVAPSNPLVVPSLGDIHGTRGTLSHGVFTNTDSRGNPIDPKTVKTDYQGNPINPIQGGSPPFVHGNPSGTYGVDAQGNPIRVGQSPRSTDAFGNPIGSAFPMDAHGNPIRSVGTTHDAYGNPTGVDSRGNPTGNYDRTPVSGNLADVNAPSNPAFRGANVDVHGNPVGTYPTGLRGPNVDVHGNRMNFDAQGNPVGMTRPIPGSLTDGNPMGSAAPNYDVRGTVDAYGNPVRSDTYRDPSGAFVDNRSNPLALDAHGNPLRGTYAHGVRGNNPTDGNRMSVGVRGNPNLGTSPMGVDAQGNPVRSGPYTQPIHGNQTDRNPLGVGARENLNFDAQGNPIAEAGYSTTETDIHGNPMMVNRGSGFGPEGAHKWYQGDGTQGARSFDVPFTPHTVPGQRFAVAPGDSPVVFHDQGPVTPPMTTMESSPVAPVVAPVVGLDNQREWRSRVSELDSRDPRSHVQPIPGRVADGGAIPNFDLRGNVDSQGNPTNFGDHGNPNYGNQQWNLGQPGPYSNQPGTHGPQGNYPQGRNVDTQGNPIGYAGRDAQGNPIDTNRQGSNYASIDANKNPSNYGNVDAFGNRTNVDAHGNPVGSFDAHGNPTTTAVAGGPNLSGHTLNENDARNPANPANPNFRDRRNLTPQEIEDEESDEFGEELAKVTPKK